MKYLENAITARNERRGLRESIAKLDHALSYLQPWFAKHNTHLLYVGVGQGHDAMHALLRGGAGRVIGVDPYIDKDGNDCTDYEALLALIRHCELENRCEIHKNTMQQYIQDTGKEMQGRFSMIIIPCTLHHIFETNTPLGRSPLLPEAISFFRGLYGLLQPGGVLVILECTRHGLRPFLKKLGLLNEPVNYTTKQGWKEWRKAIEPVGFTLQRNNAYTPYALRRFRAIFDTRLGFLGPADHYFSIYTRD